MAKPPIEYRPAHHIATKVVKATVPSPAELELARIQALNKARQQRWRDRQKAKKDAGK